MYTKLRRTFMLVSTLVLIGIILLVTGAVYAMTSHTVTQQAMVLMDLILSSETASSDAEDASGHDVTPATAEDTEAETASENSDSEGPEISESFFLALNAESLHETRYFTVRLSGDQAQVVSSSHIASVSDEDAIALARRVALRPSSHGHISGSRGSTLHYRRQSEADGSTLIIFLDTTSRFGLVRIILLYLGLVWLVLIVAYVLVMGHYSRTLVRPFVENDEKQKRFITNASHELKTPLAVISANTEMTELLSGKSKWTESTRRQLQKLQTLIENLVVLTRLDEMQDNQMTDVDLSALAREASESFRSVIEQSGRRYTDDLAPLVCVRGDARSLSQIVTILLDNAAKYCDENGCVEMKLAPRQKARTSGKSRGAVLTVSNTFAQGGSLDTSRFFERFYRQDESHHGSGTKKGFGIGLSMAREMAEAMHGKLKVSYAGDTITFTLEMA